MFLIFLCPESPAAMWIGTAVYGLFHRPTTGFCQDLNNKLTLPTENRLQLSWLDLIMELHLCHILPLSYEIYTEQNPLS